MKQILLSILLLPLLIMSAAASELYRYLPEKPVAVFELINNAVMDTPLFVKVRAAFPELDAAMNKMPEQGKNYIRKCCGAVYENGAFVMILAGDQLTEENTARHYDEFMAELKKSGDKTNLVIGRKTENNRTVYSYSNGGQDVVFVHLAPGIAMVTARQFLPVVEESAKCNEADFAAFRTRIQPTTVFAFQTTELLQKLLASSRSGVAPEGLRSISFFCELNPDNVTLHGAVGMSSAEAVKSAQLEINQMMMIMIGIGLGQDSELAGDVMKAIRITAQDQSLQMRVKASDKLLIRLGKYFQKLAEEEKARKAARRAAAGNPAASETAPALQK